jgi:methionyl-tRNA formyltransferase
MTTKPKIYFLGSGDIAIPILKSLSEDDRIELVGCGTQTDRPAGRKKKMTPTAVGAFADANGIVAERIASVNAPEFIAQLRDSKPDIVLVVSFGQLLKEELLNLPRVACVNVHASMLPKYRGASPIITAIRDGVTTTGNTFMKMDKGLDTGGIYCYQHYTMTGNETGGGLEMTLGELAASETVDIMLKIVSGKLVAKDQDHSAATVTGKIKKSDGLINWTLPADEIAAATRAYTPWPGVNFEVKRNDKPMRLRLAAVTVNHEVKGLPGEIVKADKHNWTIACGKDALDLQTVAPAGKKEMSGPAFLNGCPQSTGTILINLKKEL